jgi:lipopolysaccharide transport system ATP-binding protein
MAAVEQLCKRVVWLDKGRVFRDSEDVGKLCREYVFGDNQESTLWVAPDAAVGNSYFDLRRVALEKEDGSLLPNGLTSNDDNIYLVIEADVHELDRSLIVGYTVLQEDGQTVYTSAHTDVDQASWPEIVKGKNVLKTRIPPRFLNEGIYTVEVFACLHNRFWILEPGTSGPAVTLSISGGMSDSPYWYARRPGVTAPVLTWEAAVEERLRVS